MLAAKANVGIQASSLSITASLAAICSFLAATSISRSAMR